MSEIDDIGGMPGRRPGLMTVILWAVVTSAAVSIAVAYAQHFVTLPGLEPQEVAAPDLTEVSEVAARRLADAHGLSLTVGESRESEDVAEGDVIEQSPGIGEMLPPGGSITVVLSSGPPLVVVPDVRRRTVDEARTTLEALGLAVGTVSEGEGPEPGKIIETDPAAGQSVAPGTAIAITAAPETPPGIPVPDLSDMRAYEARRAIEDAGLEVGRVRRRYDDRRGPNVILSQDPEPGTRVEEGSEVSFVANEGV
jgi:serine/threonine-protein kinase